MKYKLISAAAIATASLLHSGVAFSAQTCNANMAKSTPTARFTVHANQTVTDQQTGLMWKQCLQGLSGADCAVGSVAAITWETALALGLPSQTAFAGHNDWRVPNIKELASIVELSCSSPSLNTAVFPDKPIGGSFVWSASPLAASTSLAWGVSFTSGNDNFVNRSFNNQVRLVRGGQ